MVDYCVPSECSNDDCSNERAAGRSVCAQCRYARSKKPKEKCKTVSCSGFAIADGEYCGQCARDLRALEMVKELGFKGTKHCKFCDRDRAPEQFSKNVQAPDGLTTKCKECVAEYNKKRNPPGGRQGKKKKNTPVEYLGKGRGAEAYLSKPWGKIAAEAEIVDDDEVTATA